MTIEKKLLGTNPVSGEVLPEAVSFDRANDYLYRSSDLTGNSDGKTFTFSCWFYGATGGTIYHSGGAGYTDGVSIGFEQSGELNIKMDNPSGSTVFSVEHGGAIAMNTWNHLLISCNMSSTSNRHIYVNDVALGNNYLTYTNSDIDFTSSTHSIVQLNKLKGRLAHLFLDYTYRDLSTTSNRRLFIDAEGKPSDTIPSSPILYLPMKDAATAGSNSGTGGDFTVNGVLATAERGPNQDNCSASVFDGSNDYLSRASISGLSDGKLFTFSVNASQTSGNAQIFTASNGKVSIKIESNRMYVRLKGSVGVALYFTSPYPANELAYGQHNSISFSCDLSDTSKRHMFINGVDVTSGITFTNYSNETALLVQTPYAIGAAATALADVYTGSIGEFYLDTAYYDLATDNPFWDSDTNRPNSVRKVIADTGVTPAIAMPLMGNDAGNNLGSGGDFTVNSGPYTGARGGSEFWARSAITGSDGASFSSTGTNLSLADTNTLTVAFALKTDGISSQIYTFNGGGPFFIEKSSSNVLSIAFTLKNSTRYTLTSSINIASSGWNIVLISIDTANDNYNIIVNGVASTNSTSIGNSQFDLAAIGSGPCNLKASNAANTNEPFAVGYLSASYYDFSQEVNRNKFVNQLGYINDLSEEGSPIIYMKFDPSSLGINSGSGGNFTVNGTVTAGVDVTP